ncbi:putative zinc finger protein [Orchesella cincta]|uniref:Putative zinc finger protein n=1 Tax=Orchesella cincta TaxID=48709 RepID=A0A1D2MVG6_ORCCI|nr:putative zinc finger protein [Orchesella cincta]
MKLSHVYKNVNDQLQKINHVNQGEKPFKCRICHRCFNNKAAMLKHEETHDKARYQGKKYHLKLSLYTHKRDHMGIKRLHPKNRKRKPRAPGSRKNEKSYRKKAGDDGEKKFACSVCAKPFFYSSEAADHATKHSPKYLYKMFFKHQCQACPPEALGFPSKKAIIAHYASAHKDLESPVDQCLYICQVCLEVDGERPVFKSHRGLWNHNKRYHSGGVPKTWKPWPRKKKLDNDDEGDDTDGEQKRLRRKRSSKLSSDRPKRTSRKVSASTKPKVPPERVSCLNCEKTFRSRYDMELHNRIHTGEKPYKCSNAQCEKAFKLKATLEYHMLTHDPSRFEGEPPYVCDFCGKGFYVWGTLYHHRRRTHLGLQEKYKRPHLKEQMKRPCECKVCGRKFHSVYALYSHKIRHGEKKYRCSVCDKPHFTSTGALEHANRHGPNRRYRIYFRHQCSGCPPEALGFPSKLAIREHWAIAHMDQKIPEKYKKPPKPKGKQKRPGPGVYECVQCPEIDGKKPSFRWQTSLYKHKKAYHSGKPKVWKSKQIGTVQKNSHDSESEDSTSCSGSSSESDEFDSETEEAQSSKKKKVSQTVRRSVRQTRSDVKNLSQLLNDSESEAEQDDDKTTEKQKTVRNKTTKLAGPSRATISAPKLFKVTTAPIARRSPTKLTGSYINQLLGGKQLRLILERIDQEIPASITTSMPTSSKSCRQKAKPNSARSSSQRTQYSNPVNNYKTSPLKIASVMSTANIETTQYVVEDEMPGLECNPVDPLSEVKLEVRVDDDDDDGLELPSYSQGIATTTTSFSQRQNNFPVIIHNPLSKNKSAAPMIVIPPPRKTNVGSHESCETIDSPSKTGNSQSDDDDDESETVLGI